MEKDLGKILHTHSVGIPSGCLIYLITHTHAHTLSVNCTPKEICRHRPQEMMWVLPIRSLPVMDAYYPAKNSPQKEEEKKKRVLIVAITKCFSITTEI